MKIENGLSISGIGNAIKNKDKTDKSSFTELFENFVKDVNGDLNAASEAEKQLMSGNVQNFEDLLYTVSKSEISLRFLVEIRNKAIESYQEIMRMQV